jgi:UDP-3-O-[3-hydroxymyristoyl] glucosamine N-acyltransferase
MTFPASQIALIINGKIEGDASLAVLANRKYEEYLYTTKASIIIINESFELKQPVKATLIRVPDAYTAFATLLAKYQEIMEQQLSGIQQPSYIAKTASYGQNIFIGAFSYIGENVKIGNNSKIFPNAYRG